MKVGLNVMGVQALYGGDVRRILDVIALADRKGVDILLASDHLGFNVESHAARRISHNFPYDIDQIWLEPLSFLSAAAAVTERIRLSTFVLVAPLRPALLLAKQLATLDVLSNGRVSIALGVGWQEKEFRAAGMQFEGRFGDLDDMVGAMRALWSPEPANYKGRNFEIENFRSLPLPVQGADLPILFGFNPTTKNLDRMARLGQGWAVDPVHRPVLSEKMVELRDLFRKYGKNTEDIQVFIGQKPIRNESGTVDWEAVKASACETVADGGTTITFRLIDYCSTSDGIEEFLDRIVALKS